MAEKVLTVLGATGSIGKSALDVVSRFPGRYRVYALAAHSNVDLLAAQIEAHRPAVAVMYDADAADMLRRRKPNAGKTAVLVGMAGLLEVSTDPKVHQVVAGMVGAVGLRPAHAAIQAGKQVALANKEVMVLAGELMMHLARESGAALLPIDSEHNAIFQCLQGAPVSHVERILLTGSGGPFRDLPMDQFGGITREQALNHPNWKMGPKITIDSATMMNKGLEVIETRWLFDVPPERIAVLMHRQSIVHSMVEFVDGSVIAQLGMPDMRTPIAHCLAYPDRLPLDLPRLNLAQVGKLEFQEVTEGRYPCLYLALRALKLGGGAPAVLNGANEEVVAAYLDGAFPFLDIAGILKRVMSQLEAALEQADAPAALRGIRTVDDAIAADEWGRTQARPLIEQARLT
ncbi:MAG TPA: 1-deoxy-D-xylulose-5-phosphate reductoisomerase [bacterium]